MSAQSLLLVPGLLCDAALWQGVRHALSASLQVGVADHATLNSIPAMAHSALHNAPANQCWVVGHSMGGRVALEMWRQAPDRILGLALLDTGWLPLADGACGAAERAQRLALLDTARRRGMREMAQAWAHGLVHPQQLDTPLYESILQMIERKTPEIFEAQIQALLARPDATGVLRTLSRPTILVCGRQDTWSPVAQHEQMSALIAGAKVHVVEGAGHMLPMEQPDATAQLIADWMKKPSGLL